MAKKDPSAGFLGDQGWFGKSTEQKEREAPVTEADIRSAYERILRRPGTAQEINAWVKWAQDPANAEAAQKQQFEQTFRNAAQAELNAPATEEKAPVFDITKDTEYMANLKKIQDQLDAMTVGETTLTPEMVKKWDDFIIGATQRQTGEAVEALNAGFNAASPYSIGSGGQLKATSDLLASVAANRATQALALGKEEVAGNRQTQQYKINMQNALNEFRANMARLTSLDDARNYWAELQRKWNVQDALTEKSWYEDIANNYKQDSSFDQLVAPILTAAGYVVGGPVGAQIGNTVANAWTNKSYQAPAYPIPSSSSRETMVDASGKTWYSS